MSINITKENFEELVMKAEKKVLLDFWTPGCVPCRMVAPVLEEIAEEREDVIVGKVNVDEEMELAMEFGVTGIPLLVVMDHGRPVKKAVGSRSKEEIEALL